MREVSSPKTLSSEIWMIKQYFNLKQIKQIKLTI